MRDRVRTADTGVASFGGQTASNSNSGAEEFVGRHFDDHSLRMTRNASDKLTLPINALFVVDLWCFVRVIVERLS